MSESQEPLQDRVAKWLGSQGYPLEMTVAASLQRAGFQVFQSDYYVDPESEALREIDIVAHLQREIDELLVRLTLVVECKASREKPWVLFTSSRTVLAKPASVVQRAASRIGHSLLMKLAWRKGIQVLPLFDLGKRCAYGLTQAFTSGADVTFSAAMTAGKAANAQVKEADAAAVQGEFCEIIFPVIVVDGKLYEYYLSESCEPVIAEVKQGVLVWRNRVVGMPHTIIHVVSLEGFNDFVSQVEATAEAILYRCEKDVLSLLADRRARKPQQRRRPS